MPRIMPPVLEFPEVRERYDTRWAMFPFENPRSYWLRSDGRSIVCTRCGKVLDAVRAASLGQDVNDLALGFCALHEACPLGYGVNGIGMGGAPPDDVESDPLQRFA